MSWPVLKYRTARIEARRGLSSIERRMEAEKDLRFWTNLGLAIAVLIGIAVIVAHGGILTAGIAAFGAALGTGGVLGFLFGVPSASKTPVNIGTAGTVAVGTGNDSKTVSGNLGTSSPPAAQTSGAASSDSSQTATAPANQDSSAVTQDGSTVPLSSQTPAYSSSDTGAVVSGSNADITVAHNSNVSNLEQVADWVTKLLLGGGLTQMQHIPPKVWQWSHVVAMGIIGDSQSPSQQRVIAEQSFAAGLLVYGFILGFFCGFLITKLQLGKAIAD